MCSPLGTETEQNGLKNKVLPLLSLVPLVEERDEVALATREDASLIRL